METFRLKTLQEFINEKNSINEDLSPKQKAYQDYFKKVLKKHDVNSPAELDEEKKKEFFNYISSNWDKEKGAVKDSAKKELEINEDKVEEETENQKAYQEFFKKTLKKYKVDSPDDLSDEDKKKFFNEIDKNWDEKTHKPKNESEEIEEDAKVKSSNPIVNLRQSMDDYEKAADKEKENADKFADKAKAAKDKGDDKEGKKYELMGKRAEHKEAIAKINIELARIEMQLKGNKKD